MLRPVRFRELPITGGNPTGSYSLKCAIVDPRGVAGGAGPIRDYHNGPRYFRFYGSQVAAKVTDQFIRSNLYNFIVPRRRLLVLH
jgi:hypothetical protein